MISIAFFRFFIFTGFLFVAAPHHPIHVSLTNIEYNASKQSFEIAFKLFTDDFEAIVEKKYGVKLRSGKPDEHPEYEKYATRYILAHFSMAVNGNTKTPENLVFKKKEQNVEAVWLYYELKYSGKIKQLKVENSLLNDYFRDQTNLVFFTFRGKQDALRLDYTVTEASFSVD